MIFNAHGNHSWRLNAFPFCLFSSHSQATSPTSCLFLSLKKMRWFCSSLVETLLTPRSHSATHRLVCISTPLSAPLGRFPSGATRKGTVRAALGGHVFVPISEGWVRLKKPLLGLCTLRAPCYSHFPSFSVFSSQMFCSDKVPLARLIRKLEISGRKSGSLHITGNGVFLDFRKNGVSGKESLRSCLANRKDVLGQSQGATGGHLMLAESLGEKPRFVCSVCLLPWCKYSHQGPLQVPSSSPCTRSWEKMCSTSSLYTAVFCMSRGLRSKPQ